jgi:hypothetical protein
VKEAVYDDAVQFIGKLGPVERSVLPNGIDGDEKVSGEAVSLTVVEGNDICVVIVLQIFYIDIQNIIIGTKYHSNVSKALGLTLGYKFEPTRSEAFFLEGKHNVFREIGNHLIRIQKWK